MSNVAVIADSAASLPPALAKKWGIAVVPLQVIVDDHSFREGEQITPAEVLAHLLDKRAVSTSQPSVSAFVQAYRRAADQGASAIVAVLISGEMSGTVNAAIAAAHESPIPVEVVDSRSVAMGTGFAAMAAAATAARGAGLDEVAQRARTVAESALCVFTLDTLEYLKRGGRVSAATAAVGNALSLRPVVEIREGKLVVRDRVRTTARARTAMLDMVDAHVSTFTRPAAAVMVLGEEQFGSDAALLLESRHPDLAMLVRTPVSAVLAAHAGPGALAAVVVDLPPEVS